MRLVVSLLCLSLLAASGAARAQYQTFPSPERQPEAVEEPVRERQEAPEEEPASRPRREAQGPAESAAERAVRHSSFSAGPGGPLLVFTQVVSGLMTGGLLGSSLNVENGAYVGAVLGGLTLGTAAALYQYYVPVGFMESLLVAGGATTGFLAGFGLATERGWSSRDRALLTVLSTQAGILGVLAATFGPGDVSQGDAALVGMTSLYAFALTGLLQSTFALADRGSTAVDLTPTLLAPALGMGLGGLLALALDFTPQRVFKLTVLPLGVGGTLLLLGTGLASGPAVPLTALGGIAATFVITLLATAEDPPGVLPPPRQRAESFQLLPVPVVMSAGRRNESLGAGPGLLLRF